MKNPTRQQILSEIQDRNDRITFMSKLERDAAVLSEVMLEMLWATRIYKYKLEIIQLNHILRTI